MGQDDRSPERPRFLKRRVSPVHQKNPLHDRRTSTKSFPKWDELPESLLEKILNTLESETSGWNRQKALFSASTVCRSWRHAIAPRLFRGLWEGSPITLMHPAQLFALSPRKENSLVKCHIVREITGGACGNSAVVYRLYLGIDPAASQTKFLLSATQFPW